MADGASESGCRKVNDSVKDERGYDVMETSRGQYRPLDLVRIRVDFDSDPTYRTEYHV